MFKFIGLALGYYLLGFFGAFLGYMIGSSVDRAQAYGIGGINPLSAGQRQKVFLDTVFILMGKLAKADGHISQDEIDHVEAFIKKMGMTTEHRQEAIDQFKKGSTTDFDMTETLDAFLASCGHTLNLKQVLLMYLTVMALADGKVDESERNVLEQIALHLGYSRAEFNRILDMVLNQAHFSQGQPDPKSALEDAYKALGVPADSTDQQVKRAYRKLMSQHHPDKLMGQGVPEDMIKVATEQAQEIQVAYDLIKKHRVN
jgi:DnaJ like chaperone protein